MTRNRAVIAAQVDLIGEKVMIGELAKLGHFLGYEVRIASADDGTASMTFTSTEPGQWLETTIAALVALEAQSRDILADEVLAAARSQLEQWHFPLTKKPSDARGIGEGHVDDE